MDGDKGKNLKKKTKGKGGGKRWGMAIERTDRSNTTTHNTRRTHPIRTARRRLLPAQRRGSADATGARKRVAVGRPEEEDAEIACECGCIGCTV
jgi:hypothetical protein